MPHRHLTEPEWVDRFLDRLGTLRPSVHAAGSRERAMQIAAESPDLGPEEAAERCASEFPAVDVGVAGET